MDCIAPRHTHCNGPPGYRLDAAAVRVPVSNFALHRGLYLVTTSDGRVRHMAKAQLSGILRHLGELRETHAVAEASDAELLGRFADRHEEAAFAGLLRRHGPMVWAVSRRVLPAVQDAEDVFQAAFLLLARKAASIRKRESVGSWLHGVALHLALKARTRWARRQVHEKRAADMRTTKPSSEAVR